jgi:cellulose synthase/poly-beta-1,6-N-acetylglucosamine synthase-like glycosyltransferase
VKYRKKKKGIVDNDFIFPESMAKPMKTLDIGIQYEASIISIAFLMVGILFFAIYVFFFAPYTWIMKGFVVFNSLCGLVLMGSMLITNYQQLITYRESTKMFDSFKDKLGTEVVSPDKINETPKTETETTIEILDNERRL